MSPGPYNLFPGTDANFNFPPQILETIASSDEVKDSVAEVIAEDPTVAAAAATAVTNEIAGRDLVETTDVRLPKVVTNYVDKYREAFTDIRKRIALGIRNDGVVEAPMLETKRIIFPNEGQKRIVANDTYIKGTVDNKGRHAEDALLRTGRVPDWILLRWKTRMAEISPATPTIPPMDIILGGGQSNMGSTSDPIPTGVDFPQIDSRIYIWNVATQEIINLRDASQASKAIWVPRAIYAFAEEYAKKQLQPGRGILIVNAAVGSSGFSTTTIVPPPAGYYNVMSDGVPRTDTGSWEVGMPEDPNNLYFRMVDIAVAARNAAPAGSVISLFMWSQGEADYSTRIANDYKTLFDTLVSNLKTMLGINNLITLVGSMVPDWVVGNGNKIALQAALEDTPRRIERSAFAWGPEGLPDWQSPIHWSAQGQLARGAIFWDAYLRAKWNVATTEPMPPQKVQAKRIGPNVLVTWEHPPSAISSFKLEYKVDSGSWTEFALSGPVVREATLPLALTSSQIVSVRLSTTNSVGLSITTREVQA